MVVINALSIPAKVAMTHMHKTHNIPYTDKYGDNLVK